MLTVFTWFYNDTPLNRNTVQIEIAIPGQQPFSVIGEVRWFERVSEKGKYHYNVGIKFLKSLKRM
jgi:hypothetical protein